MSMFSREAIAVLCGFLAHQLIFMRGEWHLQAANVASLDHNQCSHFLFNDLSPDDARVWETKLTASPIMNTKLTNDAYSMLPCAYLVLENDQTLPKEYQEQMVAQQEQKGASMVYRAPSGHSPHLSWTTGLVDKITEFVDKVISL
ncbi:hypothetical protein BDW67DRAFT_189446 [Aspergillus spinulosporus]